ncbi:DNA-binding transcriptional regulator, LysR family [Brevibacterium siliguriense]|uniref:DNA-binding transcriptional regulator, LysR family n=1 Tax=Brevibacterium siliguriense TaxID=1136497 RepID=A0A1H1QS69_9MICO|nr:LysR family transcriptional regulator [Brevibacterium siliguriense]SDS25739.1 DNA-binding transcriptional regulator, LysR family [Brevibacterium siliguriense]
MDLVDACRTFTAVSELGSMTLGAAADGIPQPVASRRIAGLEKQLGARLLERTGRGVSLTPFGRDMLVPATRLVELADELLIGADRAKLRPISLAVPTSCSTRNLAVLAASMKGRGLRVDFHSSPPGRRSDDLAGRRVRASVQTVPADEGTWAVALGCAHRSPLSAPVRIADLRRSRARVPGDDLELAGRRLRVMSEDNVPHIRDRVRRSAETAGLLPYQVIVDTSDPDAVAAVLGDGDLLLCSEAEAADLDLPWAPLIDPTISRGYELAAAADEDIMLLADFAEEVADCLGGSVASEANRRTSRSGRRRSLSSSAASALVPRTTRSRREAP